MEVASTVDKIKENKLKWFVNVLRRKYILKEIVKRNTENKGGVLEGDMRWVDVLNGENAGNRVSWKCRTNVADSK